MFKLFISWQICFCGLLLQPALAQQNTDLQRLLNNIDSPRDWNATPISGTNQATPAGPPLPKQSIFHQPNNALFTRQQILRTLFGGEAQTNSSQIKNKNWSSSTAYSNYQQAENQASIARNARERAHYDKDKGNRDGDASEAYYAANTANEASDRLYNASLNGDPTAKQYASQARAAADRARADADQARYYADASN